MPEDGSAQRLLHIIRMLPHIMEMLYIPRGCKSVVFNPKFIVGFRALRHCVQSRRGNVGAAGIRESPHHIVNLSCVSSVLP